MANQRAKAGQVFVCAACGKLSKDRYGNRKISKGWDASCMLHAVLCYEKPTEDGMWVAVETSFPRLLDPKPH